jgi:hypothetical protein
MSWFKRAMDITRLQADIEACKDKTCIENAIRSAGLLWEEKTFPNGETLLVLDIAGKTMILDPDYPWFEDAQEWVSTMDSWKLSGYVGAIDFNEEFWNGIEFVSRLYHGTDQTKINTIMKEGLLPMNETRGISNRSSGSAVFTTTYDQSKNEGYVHGDAVIQINTDAMRADGYTPEVAREYPVETEKTRDRLARALGLRQWENTRYEELGSEGLWEATILIFDKIPPKYLSLLNSGKHS